MLKLNGIKKDYVVADTKVHALKGIDLTFRENEFVSILGHSGCGKTTLLNIIGGLDDYSSGDLVINGVSTKKYKDRDWDNYRNHKIGFVFQSYNLIPHQTVLENVELALTISGISKKEKVKRAKKMLDKVGLVGQYNKKPNQLSGGQCQRVAIARALVNEPEILLADEPTGALDSETSVQIMNLISEVAKERLVIMVTHNPELAEKYSTRIIKLLDGKVVADSDPYEISPEEEIAVIKQITEKEQRDKENVESKSKKTKKLKKSKLSFWSAFMLSAKNLYSKIKRTVMVCIAGSIGIIGVATVLAVSTGVQGYITGMQNDMLSGNPVSIKEESVNLGALMEASGTAMSTQALKGSAKDGYINVDYYIKSLTAMIGDGNGSSFMVKNNITKDYVDFVKAMPKEYYSEIATYYGIDVSNNIYTNFNFNEQTNNNMSLSTAKQIYTSMLNKTAYSSYSSMIASLSDCFMQAPESEEFILSQYDIISDKNTSKIASKSNEIMIVVDENSMLTDLLLAQLGYFSQDEFMNIIYKYTNDDRYDEDMFNEKDSFKYEDLLGKTFTWYPNNTVYNKTSALSPLASVNPFTYNAYEDESWETGKELKITAILRPKDSISYGCLTSGFYYTTKLTDEILLDSKNSEIVKYLENLDEDKEKQFTSSAYNGTNIGIVYDYSFKYEANYYTETGFVGSVSQTNALIGSMTGQEIPAYYTLTLRELGGNDIPNQIDIYPKDFELKSDVTKYLDKWNQDEDIVLGGNILTAADREDIDYTDNLAIVINLVNNLINVVTSALVAFTALSLVVSTVMVAIITYVSVIERIKEIGVIRSLGGRKRDVSNLFISETVIIGGVSGLIGVGITYLLSLLINTIVGGMTGIYTIASLPISTALIMVLISIGLTLISGLIPANLAAKKDPATALRTE